MGISSMTCPNCGANLLLNNNMFHCEYCDSDFSREFSEDSIMRNNNIGSSANVTINNYYSVSPSTGDNSQMDISNKSRTAVVVLCYFLGIFGAHYFYVNKTGTGILYLCTFGLLGFGWFVDLIRTITGSFVDDKGRPITKW